MTKHATNVARWVAVAMVLSALVAATLSVRARAATEVTPLPQPSTGCAPYHLPGGTTASNNSTIIKTGPAVLCTLRVMNDGTGSPSVVNYLKLYDTAAAPTCSSAAGLVHVYPIPVAATVGVLMLTFPMNEKYANGIGFCVVSTGADTGNGNAGLGIYVEGSYQ